LQEVIAANDSALIYDQTLEQNREKLQHLIDVNLIFNRVISEFRASAGSSAVDQN
jgi:hypothetical protein